MFTHSHKPKRLGKVKKREHGIDEQSLLNYKHAHAKEDEAEANTSVILQHPLAHLHTRRCASRNHADLHRALPARLPSLIPLLQRHLEKLRDRPCMRGCVSICTFCTSKAGKAAAILQRQLENLKDGPF